MILFVRLTLGFVGLSAAVLFGLAAGVPIERITYSPKAVFLPLAAVPEITILDGSQREFISSISPLVTATHLSRKFSQVNYDLHVVRAGESSVPRLFVTSLPKDMQFIQTTGRRKELFFQSVLPLILLVNDEILGERAKLMKLGKLVTGGKLLRAEDRLWLAVMKDRYDVHRNDFKELVRRVDIVPPSLALAQAAEESGWGTSRFVIEGNALFGQWTVDGDRGLIPAGRPENRNNRVKAFNSLVDCVRAYMRNLNTHLAYRSFRAARSEMRRMGQILDGWILSRNLSSYSERGEKYIRSVQIIIGSNGLKTLDRAKLSDEVGRVNEQSIGIKPVT